MSVGYSIKLWSEDERPREKMLSKGCGSLSNAELLAIILGSGTGDLDAVGLARKILGKFGNDLNKLARCSANDLMDFKGVGLAKAVSVLSTFEIARRRELDSDRKKICINSSEKAYHAIKPMLADKSVEEFWVLLLDSGHRLIAKKRVSLGGFNSTYVDPKVLFREVLSCGAVNIVLVHNHPSGCVDPSESDKLLTCKLARGANFLSINISDHIIFSDDSYFSFADNLML